VETEFDGGVLVFRRGTGLEFLFLVRKEGWLDTPKGNIKERESAETAAIRETKEETGLDTHLDPYFKHTIQYWYTWEGVKRKKTVTYFLAEVPPDSKVKVSWEHVGFRWLSPEAAKEKLEYKDTIQSILAADDYIRKKGELEKINKEYAKLPSAAKGWGLSKRLVRGEGPANARIFVLGQAPGQQEEDTGRPFIGRAGMLLTQLLSLAGLDRRSVYITSVVQFFPPKNRMPTKEEVILCAGFLDAQVAVIKPDLLISLGNLASENATGAGKVATNHGKIVESKRFGCKVFITLHPAAAVRIKSNLPIVENDFRNLKEILKTI
jgi:DNA polymerase